MGGRGSGRYPSFGSQASLCEHALAIDLAALKRDGYLFTGCAGKINWWRHDQIANWINYRVEEEGLRLIYRTRGPGSDWRRVDELIPFVETPTQFVGWRRWFLRGDNQGENSASIRMRLRRWRRDEGRACPT